jgi:SAM-dependent methyltransferase
MSPAARRGGLPDPNRQLVRRRITEFLRPFATGEPVLDIGSGNSPYAALFPNRLCLDVRLRPDVKVRGDAHALPFRSESFELILFTEVLEHTIEPQRVVDELQRVLRPGGRVLLTTRFIFPLHDVPGDYYRFTDRALAYLFRRWSSVDIRAEATSAETLGVLLHRMSIQCTFRGGRIVRGAMFAASRVVGALDRLVLRQYGDAGKIEPVRSVLVSGWHLVAEK